MILQEILSTISDFSYFESYCQFPTLSNKSILQSSYHKINLHVKDILNQNKQI